jgi:hypothetical protein
MSRPLLPGAAQLVWPGTRGQGKRGAAGCEDHGESEWNVSACYAGELPGHHDKGPGLLPAMKAVAAAHNSSTVTLDQIMSHHLLAPRSI